MADGIEVNASRGTNPLAKDQYVRLTFLYIECTGADDEGADNTIEVRFKLAVKKNTRFNVVSRRDGDGWDGVDPGDQFAINKVVDYRVRYNESLTIIIDDTEEVDPAGNNNDEFNSINQNLAYPFIPSETKSFDQSCSDGSIRTFVKIDTIAGVPTAPNLTTDDGGAYAGCSGSTCGP